MIFGGLLSYIWVISSYYNVPENTTMLIVENVLFPRFPVFNFTYFNVTILNPSNSVSDANITTIRLTVEDKNDVHNITTTSPQLSVMRVGTRQTFKCLENWSPFAGDTVKIEPIAANASTVSYRTTTPLVKLTVTPNFDASTSVKYFNLTIGNSPQSVINLTLSEITLFATSVTANVTPSLPYVLFPGQNGTFKCVNNWENLRGYNVTITVRTSEGYETVYVTPKLLGAVLSIQEVKFDDEDTTYFNLTVKNSQDSTTAAILSRVNLTLHDNSTITLSTVPPLNIIIIPVLPNQTFSMKCIWPWNAHRNETVTVQVYTRQGLTPATMTVRTPPSTLWNITDIRFDLEHPGYFLLNATNLPTSLQNVTITSISVINGTRTITINQTIPGLPYILHIGETQTFNCTFAWAAYRGRNVNATISTQEGLKLSVLVAIPSIKLKLLGDTPVFSDLVIPPSNITIPYLNVTIWNSDNSIQNVTIKRIVIVTDNGTFEIDGSLSYPKLVPNGYVLRTGQTITIICPWNYGPINWPPGSKLKVTVYTSEGVKASRTWQ
jgi:hypothetical protein